VLLLQFAASRLLVAIAQAGLLPRKLVRGRVAVMHAGCVLGWGLGGSMAKAPLLR
jgi:hypothetical protein